MISEDFILCLRFWNWPGEFPKKLSLCLSCSGNFLLQKLLSAEPKTLDYYVIANIIRINRLFADPKVCLCPVITIAGDSVKFVSRIPGKEPVCNVAISPLFFILVPKNMVFC